MRSLTRAFVDALRFTQEDLAAIRRLGSDRGRQELYAQQTPEALESLRQYAVVESVESSNRIEGVLAPRARIQGLVQMQMEPRDRSEQEIAGYRDALSLIHESYEHMPLTTGVVRQLHQTVYRYHPDPGGDWKSTNNDIVDRDASGAIARVRFQTVSVVETPPAMDDLCAAYGLILGHQQVEPLILVPLTILDFLCIHPFRDGNGRVGRLLSLLLLLKSGYSVGRYISLERIIEESKETYYEALEASSTGWHSGEHDALPWLRYFWGTLVRAGFEFQERASLINADTKTEAIRQAVGKRELPFAISEIESDLPHVSRDLIRLVLRELRDEGAIEVLGRGRGARWRKL